MTRESCFCRVEIRPQVWFLVFSLIRTNTLTANQPSKGVARRRLLDELAHLAERRTREFPNAVQRSSAAFVQRPSNLAADVGWPRPGCKGTTRRRDWHPERS